MKEWEPCIYLILFCIIIIIIIVLFLLLVNKDALYWSKVTVKTFIKLQIFIFYIIAVF